jgi:hypothetical protein
MKFFFPVLPDSFFGGIKTGKLPIIKEKKRGKEATTERRTLQRLAGMPKRYYNSKVITRIGGF